MTLRLANLHRRFARASDGAIAVEFAFTFPILLILLFGMVETFDLVLTQHRLDTAGASVGDVIGRRGAIDTPTETDIFAAAADIMGSSASSAPNLRVSQVGITDAGVAKYDWSDVTGAFTAYAHCAKSTLSQLSGANAPSLPPGSKVIVSEIQYTWASPMSYLFKSPIVVNSATFLSPRAGSVTRDYGTGSTPTVCTGA